MNSSLSDTLTKYLVDRHKKELLDILSSSDSNRCYSIVLDFITLFEESVAIGNGLLIEPETYLSALNAAAVPAQKRVLDEEKGCSAYEKYTIKPKVHVRIEGLPIFGESAFPCNNDIGLLVKIRGTLIRAGTPKLLEYQRDYTCLKCQHVVTIQAVYERYYAISAPPKCQECNSSLVKPKGEVDVGNFVDYQEIKVQEHFGKSMVGAVPRSLLVTLEGDLVDLCKPGDDVIVTGILLRRWKQPKLGSRYDIDLVLKANNLELCNKQKSSMPNKEAKDSFASFWNHYRYQELDGKNHILGSFCPQIYGLHLAKLAMAVVLAGGVEKSDNNGFSARGMSHLLLVGDAGTGKSHLLRYASRVMNNSVFTTGVGSTSAGLTVAAVRESGDWSLEAGALVLADGGLCCIDDFNSIREHDRTSIHEAMEQQSISVAKAGMVTKLHTRCSIFATTSTKGKCEPSAPTAINVAISSPLLSRFDIVLVLADSKSSSWDRSLCEFVFKGRNNAREAEETLPDKGQALINLPWSTDDIQSYFSLIKELNPVMTPEAGLVLRSYYQFQRMMDGRNAARTTVRLLESLIRLSQGHARLLFRPKVTVLDAVTAITLIESSTLNTSVNSEVNALHTLPPKDPYDEYRGQAESILTKLKLEHILHKEMENIHREKSLISRHGTHESQLPDTEITPLQKIVEVRDPATQQVHESQIQGQKHMPQYVHQPTAEKRLGKSPNEDRCLSPDVFHSPPKRPRSQENSHFPPLQSLPSQETLHQSLDINRSEVSPVNSEAEPCEGTSSVFMRNKITAYRANHPEDGTGLKNRNIFCSSNGDDWAELDL